MYQVRMGEENIYSHGKLVDLLVCFNQEAWDLHWDSLAPDGVILYDDPTAFELEEFTRRIKPDLMGAGVKEKYVFHKMGVPFRQMHSWDYSGPYHGVDGFAVFARDMDIAINNPSWDLFQPPWAAGAAGGAGAEGKGGDQ